MKILGNGIYSLSEAARLTHLEPSRVRSWFCERENGTAMKPVFQGDYAAVDGRYAISFLDLIELFIAGQLRDHGVSLQHLRKAYNQLQNDFRESHPFCRHELLVSDAKNIFTRGLDQEGKEQVIEVLTRQHFFSRIIIPFLKNIDYDQATKLAQRWNIADKVVVDPKINFGKPIVESVGISTEILASAYSANDHDAAMVATWYGVQKQDVIAAVRFENGFAA